MSAPRQLQITLPAEVAEIVERKVASGAYASESEMIAESILTLEAQGESVEAWLAREVVPTYDKMAADPDRGLSVAEVREEIDALYRAAVAPKR